LSCAGLSLASPSTPAAGASSKPFQIEEATIDDIQAAILAHEVTTTQIVQSYLKRIKAYDGPCVSQPDGILGPLTTIKHAGQLNALITVNLRPSSRLALGLDARKARSMTDPTDSDPNMPDALEVAVRQDESFKVTGKLVGPLHGVVFAVKDWY